MSQELHCKVLHLVKQKGFYPYEYISGFENAKEELLSKAIFYNLLTGRKTSDKKYEHVFKVWDRPEMKKMKDYYDLSLKCDVLLLADVFEKFKNSSVQNYGLCPSHYLNLTTFSWDVMLDMTKFEVELI